MDRNSLLEPDSPALGLPEIDVSEGNLSLLSEQAWHAIHGANEPPFLFVFGDVMSRVTTSVNGEVSLTPLDADRMRHHLARCARWFRLRRGDTGNWKKVDVPPPLHVVRDLLADANPQVPSLSRVVRVPVFASDGTLCSEQGYNPAGQIYFAPSPRFIVPKVPCPATGQDVLNAVKFICDELLSDFPFEGDPDRCHAIALLLQPFARDLIDGPTPLYLIEKPKPGTGAGLLTEVLTHPSLGSSVPVMTEGGNDEEWRKRLTAKLLPAPNVILIDNVRRKLDSAALSAALTALTWEDRLLSTSKTAKIPVRCTWIATGNNPTKSEEMTRRCVDIRMDAKMDRPWLRSVFKHKLPEWGYEHRSELVGACLTIIAGWVAAGQPPATNAPILGSYNDWSPTMAAILEFAGVRGFLGNLQESYRRSDTEGDAWRRLTRIWWEKSGGHDVGVADLFPDALDVLNLGNGNERSQRTRLGIMLGKARDAQYGDFRIKMCDTIQGAQKWRLENVAQGSSNVPPNVHDSETVAGQSLTGGDLPLRKPREPISNASAHARASEISGGQENVHEVHEVHTNGSMEDGCDDGSDPDVTEEYEF